MPYLWTIGVLLAAAGLVLLFLRLYPPFGGRPSEETRRRMERSLQWHGGRFRNRVPTVMNMNAKEGIKLLGEMLRGRPNGKPSRPPEVLPYRPLWADRPGQVEQPKRAELPVSDGAENVREATAATTRVTWFGHSALLVETGGLRLFLDPMLGRGPSPFPGIGGQRYNRSLPVQPEDLPPLDAVFLSHDHYDHLDYGTIRKLAGKVGRYFVPLGVAAHLIRWGVEPERIQEHDWWEETEYRGLRIACTPAQHFSGRGLGDRDATLWCSWVIQGPTHRLYYSGDSGYGAHFREIGERYGPFDLGMMECGQYDPRWAAIHMMPEETVQATRDVRADWLLPIHWGAFTLAMHSWTDPVERAVRAAEAEGVRITTPRIGEPVVLPAAPFAEVPLAEAPLAAPSAASRPAALAPAASSAASRPAAQALAVPSAASRPAAQASTASSAASRPAAQALAAPPTEAPSAVKLPTARWWESY